MLTNTGSGSASAVTLREAVAKRVCASAATHYNFHNFAYNLIDDGLHALALKGLILNGPSGLNVSCIS